MQERMRKESERNDSHIWHVLRNKQVNNKHIKLQTKFGGNVKEVYNIQFYLNDQMDESVSKGFS